MGEDKLQDLDFPRAHPRRVFGYLATRCRYAMQIRVMEVLDLRCVARAEKKGREVNNESLRGAGEAK
jgi:hypothetical protein